MQVLGWAWENERLKEKERMVAEPAAIYDDVYTKAIEFLDGEDLDLQIKEEARIERAIKKPDTDGHQAALWS